MVAVKPTIFISYKHAEPSVAIAAKLYEALLAPAETWGADVFMDTHALEPADLLDEEIIGALDRTTHFIALLNATYWASPYCRKEIAHVIERFEKDRKTVRPLFVMAEEFNPALYTLAKDRASGRIVSQDPLIARLGDVVFLGPYNDARQLVRLQWEKSWALGDQINDLVGSIGRIIGK